MILWITINVYAYDNANRIENDWRFKCVHRHRFPVNEKRSRWTLFPYALPLNSNTGFTEMRTLCLQYFTEYFSTGVQIATRYYDVVEDARILTNNKSFSKKEKKLFIDASYGILCSLLDAPGKKPSPAIEHETVSTGWIDRRTCILDNSDTIYVYTNVRVYRLVVSLDCALQPSGQNNALVNDLNAERTRTVSAFVFSCTQNTRFIRVSMR